MARSHVRRAAPRGAFARLRDRVLYDTEPAAPKGSKSGGPGTGGGTQRGTPENGAAHRHSLTRTAVTKLVLLGLVVIAGTAVMIWLRDLAATHGVNWAGS